MPGKLKYFVESCVQCIYNLLTYTETYKVLYCPRSFLKQFLLSSTC